MTLASSTVSSGDDVLATQYNNLRKDLIDNAGEYATTGGTANVKTLSVDAQITSYKTGQIFVFKSNSSNTDTVTLNVNSIGAKTIKKKNKELITNLIANDLIQNMIYFVAYDGTNLILLGDLGNQKFAGNGSDGVQGDANLTITGSNNTIITKNFTSWTGGTSARVCTITPTGCLTHIKIQGDADFSNWTFNFAGKGGAGGVKGAAGYGTSAGADGTDGEGSSLLFKLANSNKGTKGQRYGAGGGGGAGGNNLMTTGGAGQDGGGATGSTGGIGGASQEGYYRLYLQQVLKVLNVTPSAGGGGGAGGGGSIEGGPIYGYGGAGGDGGNAGGGVIIEIGGNVTFSSTSASVNGEDGEDGEDSPFSGGSNSGGGGGGGGGGGAGGYFALLYNGTQTGTLTPTVAGGSAGIGGSGASAVYPGGNGGNGGGSGDGDYLVEKNENF